MLALGTLVPQALAIVGIAYAPLLAMGMAPNPLWCLWSAIAATLFMMALSRQRQAIWGVRPSAALLYGSTLAICVSLAPALKLSPLGAMGLAAASMMLSAGVIWVSVKTGLTMFARYLPAPVGRGLGLGFGLTILWLQLRTVGGWFVGADHRVTFTNATVVAVVLLALMVRLVLLWRRDHPSKPYLLALLPVAALVVWVLEAATSIPFAWVSAPAITHWSQMLPPLLARSFAHDVLRADHWALAWTVLTVLTAQALFVAFTFIVDSAGNAANMEHLTGEPYDLNAELRASALAMAVLPWFGLLPASQNLAATRPLLDNQLGRVAHLSNGVVAGGLALLLLLAWAGLDRVPALFVIAALIVIGLNMLEPVQLERPGADPGERQMWWQSWIIGLVFLFTSGIFAMLAGFVVAVAQFVKGAEGSVVRAIYTLREMRSRRWRSVEEEIALRRAATRVVVVALQGTANFAVARRIREQISQAVRPDQVDVLLIDAQRVVHWDVTALDSFRRLADDLQRTHVELLLSHPSGAARRALAETTRMFTSTDRALEWAENEVLRRQGLAALLVNKPLAAVADLPLCADITGPAAADLARFGTQRSAVPGEQLFNTGDRDATLMVLLAGTVTLELPGRTEALRVATFGAGMMFGEMAFLDGSARSARAVAVENCRLFCLPRAGFDQWAQHHPNDAQRVLKAVAAQMSRRLRFTTTQLIALNP